MNKPITFGSLFAGIGGIDLGLERAGMRCEWQVEIDDYAQKVLAKHWPDVTRFRDVRSIGRHIGDIHTCYIPVSRVDVLAGGFPCQPHSQAGERKASSDERDLWPEFHRLIRELEPRWVVAENVLGLLSSEDGAFFGGVLRDLAACGYDARWQVLSAAQFGAPHLRERVIIVAHHPGIGSGAWRSESAGQQRTTIANSDGQAELAYATSAGCTKRGYGSRITASGKVLFDEPFYGSEELAYTSRSECEWCWDTRHGWNGPANSDTTLAHASSAGWQEWDASTIAGKQGHTPWRKIAPGTGQGDARATQPQLGGATHGLSGWLDGYRWPARPGQSQEAWEAPRVTVGKITNRSARLKGLGNAVVPALAEYVGRCIVAAEAERECVA